MSELVSVIIPTYKRPTRLKRSILSVLEQTYKNLEIIVVDDNNPDSNSRKETESIMEEFSDRRNIKYVRHSKNLNGSAARNTGIKNSKGKYIAFLDNDDEFLSDKIELQVNKLKEMGDSYGIVYTKFIRKRNGKLIEKGIENRTGSLAAEILKGSFYISAGSNILVRREIVEQINGFNEQFLRRQDLEFLIRASQITKITHVNKVCLIINKDDRSNEKALTKKQREDNTKKYLEVFKKYIEGLSVEDQEKVRIYLELQKLRPYMYKGKVLSIIAIARKENIKVTILLKYIFYLVKRKVLKQCYGFAF